MAGETPGQSKTFSTRFNSQHFTLCCGPMPTNLQRLSACMNNILAALECPVCLETISPPAHQCANGHLICLRCRMKTDKCPVCRLKLFRGRSLLADQVYNSLIDAFDLKDKEESKRKKMLKEKLMGHKNGLQKNKPDIKINFLSSPTNKFLTRLLKSGKYSSAENLTQPNSLDKNSSSQNHLDDFNLGLKAKSFSSNEIFRFDNQVSRTTSILSNRPGSGLLEVQPLIFSKRPASYHGSVEELMKRSTQDFGNDDSVYQTNQKCCCPCDSKCQIQICSASLIQHIQHYHDGPILQFFKPQISLSLPLADETVTVMITYYNTVFIVKILRAGMSNKDYHLWVWSLNSKEDFNVHLTYLCNNSEKTSEFAVIGIETTSWEQISNEKHGLILKLTDDSMKVKLNIVSNFS